MLKYTSLASEAIMIVNMLSLIQVYRTSNRSEQRQTIFNHAFACHGAFLLNNLAIFSLKFVSFKYTLGLQLLNDLGCSVSILPTYGLWIYHDYNATSGKDVPSIVDSIIDHDETSAESLIE